MMNKLLVKSQASLLAVLLVAVIVSCNEHEVQARTTPAVQRKPPFNGSIFGKRSNLATSLQVQGASEAADAGRDPLQVQLLRLLSNRSKGSHLLASLLQRQQQQQQQSEQADEALRETIGRCLGRYETGRDAPELCEELLAYLANLTNNNVNYDSEGLLGLVEQRAQ